MNTLLLAAAFAVASLLAAAPLGAGGPGPSASGGCCDPCPEDCCEGGCACTPERCACDCCDECPPDCCRDCVCTRCGSADA